MRSIIVSALCIAAVRLSAATPPTVQSVLPPPGTVDTLTQITVMFSEPVSAVSAGDLLANGVPAVSLSAAGGGAVYTFTLDGQPAYGTVEITWDTGQTIADLEVPPNPFNANGPGATWQYNLVDNTAPAIASLIPAAGSSVRVLTQIEVLFTEGVVGLNAADLLVNGSPATGLTPLGLGHYRFTFAPPANGTVQFAWAAGHGITDFAAAHNPFAGGNWTVTLNPNLGVPSIRINEFTAANISGLLDENGEAQDWIEIWNYGAVPVNLTGYSLTDDADDPGRWTFPATNLAAGQYLVVFASSKDRRTITASTNRFHTNFKLGTDDFLGLYDAGLPRTVISEFAPEYPEQRNNYSYGYDGGILKYFATPTPGAANGSSSIAGLLPPPHFNVARGLFDQPFTLILSSTSAGAAIRYTTDGTEPTGTSGQIYNGALTISNTTVLRAAAFGSNYVPSATVTHSYFFIDQVVVQPSNPAGFPTNWGCCGNVNDVSGTATFPPASTVPGVIPADYAMDLDPLRVDPSNPNSPVDAVKLQRLKDGLREIPTLSIVMKTDDIFGTTGLYQRSADETGTSGTKPDNKKPCSIEMILPDGTTAFATTCGIDLHGNASRNPIKNPKHGFKLHFRGDFGPGTLQYRLFEDSPVEEYDDVLLRADFNSSWRHWSDTTTEGLGALQRTRAVRTRDAWMKDSMREMGGLASHNRFVHVYLNGLYWGTYDFSEDPRGIFAKNALGGTEDDYDLVDQGVMKGGTADAYNAMRNLPAATTLAVYEQYFQYLNVSEFADYMLLHFFMGHQDWATSTDGNKNWAAVRKRVPGPEGVFHYQAWDGECILLNEDINRTTIAGGNYPTGLHGDLDDSPEYRLVFADRVHRHMIAPGGALTPPVNTARWQKWQAVMDKPIVAESARWGDYRRDVHQYQTGTYQLYTRENHWLPENDRMVNLYFPNRNATVLTQLRTAGLYPTVSAPVFNQQGGFVSRGFGLTMTATNSIYFTTDGSDPRVYGSGDISPNAVTYVGAITLTNPVVVKARARFGTTWSALNEATFTVDALGSPLRITEIMYNPMGGDAYEYLELQNVGLTPFNAGGYGIPGVDYVFPPGTVLAPGQVIVLASAASPGNWTNRYPGVAVFGRFAGKLDNAGERLSLRKGTGPIAWSVDYDDEDGWPAAADGQGPSLEIIDVFGNPDDPANWRASATTNGTPGTITPPPPPPTSIVINEIMADNGVLPSVPGVYPDWVELHNRGGQTVNLAGWSLTDNSDPRRYVFPATNIPPGGYVFVWMGQPQISNELVAPFGLGRNDESLFLYDANTNLVDSVGYGLQLTNYSIGRVNGEWQLTQPTPKAANVAVSLASASGLVINEWMAVGPVGTDDWIELHNRSNAPVLLRGIYLGMSSAVQQIQALSFIAPGGFVQFLADGNSGANNLNFTLPEAGGTIVLYSPSGVELDRVTYGPQTRGVSQGRLPDGGANVVSFPASPSPAASNYLLNYGGPFLNEILAINDAAVTNGSGRTADFVELRNTNATPWNLSGMSLSVDPADPFQWVFPAGASIAGNGYRVIWFDNERPASTANEAVLNTGVSIDGESAEVRLYNVAGQQVDGVAFGFQVGDRPIGRDSGTWTLLSSATPGAANSAPATLASAAGLRINEWMASPLEGNDWFEIYNDAGQPVALAGLYLADSPSLSGLTQSPIGPLSFIGAKGFVKCVADGQPGDGGNHVSFSLAAEGEALRIASPVLGVIDTAYFGLQQPGVSQGSLPDGSDGVADFATTPTPGESNFRPHPNVVINEVLSRSDVPLEDAVEIYNQTGLGIDLSGWFLSDSPSNFKKYRVADGTSLPAGGYKVYYETQFNSGAAPFALNSGGGRVFLSEADAAGNLSGYRAVARFGAALNGTSFGRFETCSGADFVAMTERTFGQDTPASVTQFRTGGGLPNASPRIGPVVINELMFHPPDIASNDNVVDEYIELHNFSAGAVPLFDPANPGNTWRLRGGVDFSFPQNVTLGAGGYLLVVSFDPVLSPSQLVAFRSRYGVPGGVAVLGPYSGKLENGGERVELLRPDTPQGGTGVVPYLLVDGIDYDDASPWPTGGDGDGASYQRSVASEFGNDAANWVAAGPTAGKANPTHAAVAPSVVAQPISRTVPQGSRVVFNVSACGGRPLTYQWRFNGSNLTGETNVALVIGSAQVGNVGSYTVLVGNGAGSQLSAPATLALGDLPVITQQPQPQTAGGGSETTFSVAATGAGPLSYQWRRNGTAISGATNAVLLLTNLRFNDSGDYSVLVINPAGAVASATASLLVLVPPTITAHPQNQSVAPNGSVTFSVTANGVGTLRYQWQFNGVNLTGQTNSTLNLTGVTLANEGDYRVLVSDDITGGLSLVARLTVRVPPVILSSSGGVTNVVGSTISLSVTASGSVPMAFRWYKGSAGQLTNILFVTSNTFTIFDAKTNDSATYRVVLTNAGNLNPVVNTTFVVRVVAPPVITNHPASQSVAPGGTAMFTVGVGGTAPFDYRWRFQGVEISGATNASLNVTPVDADDQGGYEVVVSNFAGSVTSAMATLAVTGPPTIARQPRNQEASVGGSATFNVLAAGVGPLTYQWLFNGTNLNGQISDVLTLANIQAASVGAYSVVVGNSFGPTLSQPAQLSLLGEATLQNPVVLGNGSVTMGLVGAANRSYAIEISSSLTNWTTLITVVYTNGVMTITDSTANGTTNRFYRTRLVQ